MALGLDTALRAVDPEPDFGELSRAVEGLQAYPSTSSGHRSAVAFAE